MRRGLRAAAFVAASAWAPDLLAGSDCGEDAPTEPLPYYVELAVRSHTAGDELGLYSVVRDVELAVNCSVGPLAAETAADVHYVQGLKHASQGEEVDARPYFCATWHLFPGQNWPRNRGFGDEALEAAWEALECAPYEGVPLPPPLRGRLSVDGRPPAQKPEVDEALPLVLQYTRSDQVEWSLYVHPHQLGGDEYEQLYHRLGRISGGLGLAGAAVFGAGQWTRLRLEGEVELARTFNTRAEQSDVDEDDLMTRRAVANGLTAAGLLLTGAGAAGGAYIGYVYVFR